MIKESKTSRASQQLKELMVIDESFQARDFFLSESEISKRLSISRTTTRRALQNLVASGYLEPKRGQGYQISRLPEQEWASLGIIMAETNFEEKSTAEGCLEVTKLARKNNCRVELIGIDELKTINQKDFKGFLSLVNPDDLPCKIEIPVVTLGTRCSRKPYPNATVDVVQAGYQIGRHLAELQHRHIALLETKVQAQSSIPELVLMGMKQALGDRDVIRCKENRAYAPSEATQRLLQSHREITALVILDYRELSAALALIHQLNIRIPADLSVIGFGNCIYSYDCYPPLTCIQSLTERFYVAGMQLLFDIIKKGCIEIQQVFTRAELKVRESTGPARSEGLLTVD